MSSRRQPTWRPPFQPPPKLAELLVPTFDFGIEYEGEPLFSDAAPQRTFIGRTSKRKDFAARLAAAFPSLVGTRIFAQEDAYKSIHWPTVGNVETFEDLTLGATAGVLGPESGEWVIVINDEWQAIVGARSHDDLTAFEEAFGDRRRAAVDFVEYWEDFAEDLGTDWLVPLLRHVLPPVEVEGLLANEGRWLAEPPNADLEQ